MVAECSRVVLAPIQTIQGDQASSLWAAAAGKPVVAVNRGCIQHVVETQQLGTTCNVRDTEEFATAIQQALSQPWTEVDAARVRNYAHWHRVENYQSMCAEFVRSRVQANRLDMPSQAPFVACEPAFATRAAPASPLRLPHRRTRFSNGCEPTLPGATYRIIEYLAPQRYAERSTHLSTKALTISGGISARNARHPSRSVPRSNDASRLWVAQHARCGISLFDKLRSAVRRPVVDYQ